MPSSTVTKFNASIILLLLRFLHVATAFSSVCYRQRDSRPLQATTEDTTLLLASKPITLSHMEFSSKKQRTTGLHSPALFLHGLLGNKRNFSTIANSLSDRLRKPRKIYALDLRNHGENTKDEWRDDMSYTTMAQDILCFLDQHEMEQVELIGHSVGGKVAQTVALLAPERVAGLVVLDIAPVRYTSEEPHWQAVEEIISTLVQAPSAGISKREMDLFLRDNGITDPAVRAFCLTNYADEDTGWKIPVHIFQSQLETLAGFDAGLEKQWYGDAFFIHGGQSRFVRSSHMENIGSFFPHHMLTTVRGAGHWIHAEAPEDTTALLQQYLDR